MAVTIHAVFDGEVLRPEESVNLEPRKRYRLTVEEDAGSMQLYGEEEDEYPLRTLLREAIDFGVTDLAQRHDDYARRRYLVN